MKAREVRAISRGRDAARRASFELADILRARREEMVQATLTRVHAIADPSEAADPTYIEGLRIAVDAALEYGIAGLEIRDEERVQPVPAVLLSQARLAARNRVSLDTVLRRYFAGYTLLGDFLMQEAAGVRGLESVALKRLLRVQASLFDRLIAAVSEEYASETRARCDSAEQRHAGRVEGLLKGDLIDTAALSYDLGGFHIGVVAVGSGAAEAIREWAASLDRHVLLTNGSEDVVWAWLGGRERLEARVLERRPVAGVRGGITMAIGEQAGGVAGWRLTHWQAKAALPIALRRVQRVVHYADVAILASVLRDEVLVLSLRQLYLDPLKQGRNDGGVLRQTLRAYLPQEPTSLLPPRPSM